MPKFTDTQLRAFARYERVQRSNKHNMLTLAAAREASLTAEEHVFCIEHYADLLLAAQEYLTVELTISPAIFNDLCVRSPDPDGCWRGIESAGKHTVTRAQARQIRGDCDYQGNVSGDYIDPVSSGLTHAYRSLYKKIDKVLS